MVSVNIKFGGAHATSSFLTVTTIPAPKPSIQLPYVPYVRLGLWFRTRSWTVHYSRSEEKKLHISPVLGPGIFPTLESHGEIKFFSQIILACCFILSRKAGRAPRCLPKYFCVLFLGSISARGERIMLREVRASRLSQSRSLSHS